jgi:ATP-dependent RNA helicase DDX60
MSFVPAPQQASAAANNLNNAAFLSNNNAPFPPGATTQPGEAVVPDQELIFKIRTFDVYWVEKNALMYKDGIAKVSIYISPLLLLVCWD